MRIRFGSDYLCLTWHDEGLVSELCSQGSKPLDAGELERVAAGLR